MKRIFKYNLHGLDNELELPVGSKILSVQYQGDDLHLWALVDIEVEKFEKRNIQLYGTGWDVDTKNELVYITTLQNNSFVWHVFEEIS